MSERAKLHVSISVGGETVQTLDVYFAPRAGEFINDHDEHRLFLVLIATWHFRTPQDPWLLLECRLVMGNPL